MAGQADDSAPTFDDIAGFLVDNPEADEHEDRAPSDGPDDSDKPDDADTSDEDGASPDDPESDDDEAGDGDDEDADGEPAKGRQGELHEVTVKGADGAETKERVSLEELKSSYMRHADYTRGKMELSTQRAQLIEAADTRVRDARTKSQDEIAFAHRAIVELAALPSAEELAQLAQRDGQAYMQEKARIEYVESVLNQLRGAGKQTLEQSQAEARQADEQAVRECWGVLQAKGVTAKEIPTLFETIHKEFGIPRERFQNLKDPALVLIMRKAVEAINLERNAKTTVKDKVAQAKAKPAKPSMPSSRQVQPPQSRRDKVLDRKFKSGSATVKDLAASIERYM